MTFPFHMLATPTRVGVFRMLQIVSVPIPLLVKVEMPLPEVPALIHLQQQV
jgi:hypothetical protein